MKIGTRQSSLTDATAAQAALQRFWGTRGDEGYHEARIECQKLSADQLRWLEGWIPAGQGLTADKCKRARELVRGVIAEKG
jgi:hypothetical protein